MSSAKIIHSIAPSARPRPTGSSSGVKVHASRNTGTASSRCGRLEKIAQVAAFTTLVPRGAITGAMVSLSDALRNAMAKAMKSHSFRLPPRQTPILSVAELAAMIPTISSPCGHPDPSHRQSSDPRGRATLALHTAAARKALWPAPSAAQGQWPEGRLVWPSAPCLGLGEGLGISLSAGARVTEQRRSPFDRSSRRLARACPWSHRKRKPDRDSRPPQGSTTRPLPRFPKAGG